MPSVMSPNSYARRYAFYGAAFGALFPVISTLLDAHLRFGNLSLHALAAAQAAQPLHWTIDSAPLWLGLFAWFAGLRQDRVLATNAELRAAEAELRRTNDSLIAAAKVKSQFLANMSHELRTPLNAIIGFSRIMARKLAGKIDRQQEDNLKLVLQSGVQMLALVNDLLDLEKISSGTLSIQAGAVDAVALFASVAETTRPAAVAKGLSIEATVLKPPLELRTDENRLRQIVVNLVNNAINYSDKGTIRVECRRSSDGGVEISVRDEGIGIAADAQKRIFEAFEQVDPTAERSRAGAGLGLAIVKQLVEVLGGSVGVTSEVGRGSTFKVSLPESVLAQPGRAPASRHPGPRGTGPLVLVIDDQPTNLELIAAEISEAGYRVHTALSGKEGLEKAHALKPDVIILDIIMPEMDGWQVLRALRQDPATGSIPVVISSVLDRSPTGYDLGVAGWLAKPIDANEFRRVMGALLTKQQADVLAVDDDEATRSLIEQELQPLDCRVRLVASGNDALAALEDRIPDVMVLDLNLPGIDGFEVYKRLRSRPDGRAVPVVIFTGRELSADDRKRLNGGLAEIVQKNQGKLDLVEAVRHALFHPTSPPTAKE